jgi:3-carboxy-cis,cis-muconate cycloisomerase
MSTSLSPLLAPMLSSPAMRAVCDHVACLQQMLEFEAALARAEAATGMIPAGAAGPIGRACKAGRFDLAALAEAATRSGNLAIPLVKALTGDARVTAHLSADKIAQLFEPMAYQGVSQALIDRLLASLDDKQNA